MGPRVAAAATARSCGCSGGGSGEARTKVLVAVGLRGPVKQQQQRRRRRQWQRYQQHSGSGSSIGRNGRGRLFCSSEDSLDTTQLATEKSAKAPSSVRRSNEERSSREFVSFFRDAVPYIQWHTKQTFVVVLSGEIAANPEVSTCCRLLDIERGRRSCVAQSPLSLLYVGTGKCGG